MTQHRELATAIRCAVFDKIESDGMLVSSGVEQAIEDALILHAAKGGQRPTGEPAKVVRAAVELYKLMSCTVLFDTLPGPVPDALRKFRDLLITEGLA